MNLSGTEIHIVTFCIVIVEAAMFCFQLIYYLHRPSDKNRLWYLLLLYFLIQYNLLSGFLPDKDLPVPYNIQVFLAYFGGVVMSLYFPFYIYKAFQLNQLKRYAYWGAFLFIFLPFVFLFGLPYLISGNLDLSRKLVVVVPFLYGISLLYSLGRAIHKKYYIDNQRENEPLYKEKIFSLFLGLTFWISLPVIVYFDGSQLLENSTTNAGLLVMTIIYIRSTIYNSKQEYQQLVDFNKELSEKVKERTRQLELINEQQTNTFINLAHETKTPLTLIRSIIIWIYTSKREERKRSLEY